MKRLFVTLFILSSLAVFAQKEDSTVFDIVKSGKYIFDPIRVSNSSLNSYSNEMNLQADGYYFRFKKDSLSADMPYVGVMTNTPVPDAFSNGIMVDSKVTDYTVKEIAHGKKLQVSFNAYSKKSNETYRVVLTVTESGSADVTFKSGKRSYISFIGELK